MSPSIYLVDGKLVRFESVDGCLRGLILTAGTQHTFEICRGKICKMDSASAPGVSSEGTFSVRDTLDKVLKEYDGALPQEVHDSIIQVLDDGNEGSTRHGYNQTGQYP